MYEISLTTSTLSSTLGTNDDLVGQLSAALVELGFAVVSDTTPTGAARAITLSMPHVPYGLLITNGPYYSLTWPCIELLAHDYVSMINQVNMGYGTTFQAATIKVLSGANTLLINITTTSLASYTLAFLKFSDGNWYLWVAITGSNGSMFDNLTDNINSLGASPCYPSFVMGSYPMLPFLIQASNNVWDSYPLSIYSISPAAFSNNQFYAAGGKNYFHFGNLMISD